MRGKAFIYESLSEGSFAFSITSDAEILAGHPYDFELKIIYTLIGKTIKASYQVTNREVEKVMPYFIGEHLEFNYPLLADECYEDYYLELEKEGTCIVPESFPETELLDVNKRTPFLGKQSILNLDYALFVEDVITLDKLASRSASLKFHKHDKGLRLDFEDSPNLILWLAVNKGPFIVLESWSGSSTSLDENDILEDRRQVAFVVNGEVSKESFDITIF